MAAPADENGQVWIEFEVDEEADERMLRDSIVPQSTVIHDHKQKPVNAPTSTTEQMIVSKALPSSLARPSAYVVARELWTNKVEFLLSVIGYVVDLGNVWRFPYTCYENGGGAFLIPYTIFLCVLGIPMLYLELFLGQFYHCGNITLWGKIAPSMKGIGIASFAIVTAVTLYYTTIIAHAAFYLVASFRSVMPWSLCSHAWNTAACSERMRGKSSYNETIPLMHSNHTSLHFNESRVSSAEEYYNIYMLGINHSKGLTDLGSINIDLLLCLIFIFALMYICIFRGVKSTGKAVYVTAVLPYIVLIILLVQGFTLEGSQEGIVYFLKPTFSRLKDFKVWYSAANQIFFTLGSGLSVLTTYGSYNIATNNCYYDALIAVIANFVASFLAGFVVFSALGHMAWRLNKDVTNVVDPNSSLSFIAYPEILATFKYPTFFSVIFFLMVINLGLDSDFGGLEAMYTALSDEYSLLKRHRKSGMFIMCCILIIACLPTVTNGGMYVVQYLDKFSTGPALMLVVMMESVAASWVYGINNIADDIQINLGFKPNILFRFTWKILCPAIVIVLMVLSLVSSDELTYGNYHYPQWTINIGWILNMSLVLPIPIIIIYVFLRYSDAEKSFRERVYCLFKPNIAKQRFTPATENGIVYTSSTQSPFLPS